MPLVTATTSAPVVLPQLVSTTAKSLFSATVVMFKITRRHSTEARFKKNLLASPGGYCSGVA